MILPGLPIRHIVLESVLPGFEWISFRAFAIGLVESFLFGAYAGLSVAMLHNLFARRQGSRRSALSVTSTT